MGDRRNVSAPDMFMGRRLTAFERDLLAAMDGLSPVLRGGMLALMHYLATTDPDQRSCQLDHDTHGRLNIRCRLCDALSFHPADIINLYCGRCHLFHPLVAEARQLREHVCQDWRTARRTCAVCGKDLVRL
jgi:hypothetical protein